MSRETFTRSLGTYLQLGCFILLLALIPYTLYSGVLLYRTAISWTGGEAGPLVYATARVIACAILIYALWQLRKTGSRLRRNNPPNR
jgi:hypothetical protein